MNNLNQINLGDRLRIKKYGFAEIRSNIEDSFLWKSNHSESYFRIYYISSDYIIDSSFKSIYIFLNGSILEVDESYIKDSV